MKCPICSKDLDLLGDSEDGNERSRTEYIHNECGVQVFIYDENVYEENE